MEVETIRQKQQQYTVQREEAVRRRAELARALEETERQIIALSGAIEALEELLQEPEGKPAGEANG